ncbi:MAG: rhomboid family intramembrane serine protease [Bacilli bacterium]|nr:rhomboid family intramembrane serine protease [Bacilli bacterium]
MAEVNIDKKNETVMKLLHYFITVEGYNPIVLHGAENEIWLENLDNQYKVVRIASNYIHNNEQYEFDLFRTKQILKLIRRKTLSFKMQALSIFVNLGDNVDMESTNNIDCVFINDEKDINKYDFLIEKFPMITSKLKYDEEGVNLFVKITREINSKNESDAKKTNDVFAPKKPYLTYTLIFINILVYLLMTFLGRGSTDIPTLLYFGALYSPLVRAGEYYRLITNAFLHIGLIHLFFNNYVLYIVGSQIESFYGRFKFIIIYLVSALFGSLMSMIFTEAVSAGASGAIFGLLGSLLYFGYHYRVYLGNAMRSQIVPLIIFNLLLGFVLPGIDNAAHIGGLIGGVLASAAVGVKYKGSSFEKINGAVMSIIALIFLVYMAFIYAV